MQYRTSLTLTILLALAASAHADEWMQATVREQSSANGQFTVRVTPGDSWGDVVGFADRPKGRYATAEWFKSDGGVAQKTHTITLLNPIAPVDFLVTDNGALITLDNWHNVGYGSMLVVYSPSGETVKKYGLGELYSFRDTQRFGFSTSSINWRCASPVLNSPTELWVDDTLGGRLVINTVTGTFEYRRGASTCREPPAERPAPPVPAEFLALPWGQEVDGLRLNVDVGRVTAALPTGDRLLLDLYAKIHNVSGAPVAATLDWATYNFDYEIDGVWYAFDDAAPIQTPWTVARAKIIDNARTRLAALDARDSDLWPTIAPGSVWSTYLPVPLVSPAPSLQLHAITANGPGRKFQPTPGPHTLRLRTSGVLEPGRPALLSNAITITLRPLPQIETRNQDIAFVSSPGTALGNLHFAKGPAGDQALIRQVLARPPQPSNAPLVVHSTALQVAGPLPRYDLRLSRAATAPEPALPTTIVMHHYLVRSGGQFAAMVFLSAAMESAEFVAMSSDRNHAPLFDALQELSGMEAVRGGSYEPRLLQVSGDQGMSALQVIWLHSSAGKPDLLYMPRDPNFRGVTQVQSGKVYTFGDFVAAARGTACAVSGNETDVSCKPVQQ